MLEKQPLNEIAKAKIEGQINLNYFLLIVLLTVSFVFAYGLSKFDKSVLYWIVIGIWAYSIHLFFGIKKLKKELIEGSMNTFAGILIDKFTNVQVRKGQDIIEYYIGVENETSKNRHEFEVTQREYDKVVRFEKVKVSFTSSTKMVIKIEK